MVEENNQMQNKLVSLYLPTYLMCTVSNILHYITLQFQTYTVELVAGF
jgi:hypothetical protein